ncbi:hypothetical protein [Bacillus sp. S/N-304-OC-R1]|uniref:hypothetical protein n=1 Tax=Bacillus sp. S/N-304-OC-R1 TaxID=2758034 RepID=UPI001C8E8DD9|nr:hypothetical protein [Bacillus sp. S/N-304-OC-R1]MBY0121226.1 hypothetical protein [Bacillus sp. S/N-304-OC-R1]
MKENIDQTSEGLNQLFEVINAKGDTGEINEIVKRTKTDSDRNNEKSQNDM